METDTATIREPIVCMLSEARRLGFSESYIRNTWVSRTNRIGIVPKSINLSGTREGL